MASRTWLNARARLAGALSAAVLASGLLLTELGSAEAAPAAYRGTDQDQSACMGDVFRLCFSDIPDERAIVACLIRSKRNLSPGCGAVFKVRARPTAVAKVKSKKKIVKRRRPHRA